MKCEMEHAHCDHIPYFRTDGLNCAESTLRLLRERGVLEAPDEALRMASGFGGGMQRGLVCGALTAGVMAIGTVFGRTEPEQSRAPSAAAVREFIAAFEKRFGALDCAALTDGLVSKSPEMYDRCAAHVLFAAEAAAVIIRQGQPG